MSRHIARGLAAAALVAIVAILSGCASPASRESMVAPPMAVAKKLPYTVTVDVQGGSETGAMDSSNIANADFKAALESSIAQTGLFKGVVQGKGGDYELTVTITHLSKPTFGASFTVELEAGWVLTNASTRAVVMRKPIRSSHTATMGDSLAGVTRLRLAVEGAARANIAQGLKAIGELNL